MPLRCFDPPTGTSIQAFDLSADAWSALETSNRRSRHLRMPCCDSQVTLRKSRLGTQFFAHKTVGSCATAPESEAHLRLKQIAVEVARDHGWEARTEVSGSTPTGECWTADVLATRGERKVAIEIQWSAQTDEETRWRQARYVASGVRCLWLFRQRRFPISQDVPAALVSGDPSERFEALLTTESGVQRLSVEEFLAAAFSKRLKFGIPVGIEGRVSIRTGETSCWNCGCDIAIVTRINLTAGPHSFEFTIPDLTGHASLLGSICSEAKDVAAFRGVKVRPSKTQQRSYLSNGCSHCNALYGEFHEHDAWDGQQVAAHYVTNVDECWLRLIGEQEYEVSGWGVFDERTNAEFEPPLAQ